MKKKKAIAVLPVDVGSEKRVCEATDYQGDVTGERRENIQEKTLPSISEVAPVGGSRPRAEHCRCSRVDRSGAELVLSRRPRRRTPILAPPRRVSVIGAPFSGDVGGHGARYTAAEGRGGHFSVGATTSFGVSRQNAYLMRRAERRGTMHFWRRTAWRKISSSRAGGPVRMVL